MANLHSSRVFTCPFTGHNFTFNTALNGHHLTEYFGSNTPLFYDTQPHSDGLITVAYLDGRVARVHP